VWEDGKFPHTNFCMQGSIRVHATGFFAPTSGGASNNNVRSQVIYTRSHNLSRWITVFGCHCFEVASCEN